MKTAVQFTKQVWAGLLVLLAMTLLVGIIYPAVIWGASRLGTNSAEGSPIKDSNGCVVGSSLIGVDPQVPAGAPDPYFHNRVTGSISDNNAFAPGDPSAALPTNQGPSSEALAAFISTRRATIAKRENVNPDAVPVDAVTGSGSGVDPDISPAYAAIQVDRVAKANSMPVSKVEQLVQDNTKGRQLGFLGSDRVDVATLNVALGLTAPTCGS